MREPGRCASLSTPLALRTRMVVRFAASFTVSNQSRESYAVSASVTPLSFSSLLTLTRSLPLVSPFGLPAAVSLEPSPTPVVSVGSGMPAAGKNTARQVFSSQPFQGRDDATELSQNSNGNFWFFARKLPAHRSESRMPTAVVADEPSSTRAQGLQRR